MTLEDSSNSPTLRLAHMPTCLEGCGFLFYRERLQVTPHVLSTVANIVILVMVWRKDRRNPQHRGRHGPAAELPVYLEQVPDPVCFGSVAEDAFNSAGQSATLRAHIPKHLKPFPQGT